MSSIDHRQPELQSAKRTEVATVRARQGVTGHNVRYVLGLSPIGVVVAFAIIYALFFA